jgi:hypothetical protein
MSSSPNRASGVRDPFPLDPDLQPPSDALVLDDDMDLADLVLPGDLLENDTPASGDPVNSGVQPQHNVQTLLYLML